MSGQQEPLDRGRISPAPHMAARAGAVLLAAILSFVLAASVTYVDSPKQAAPPAASDQSPEPEYVSPALECAPLPLEDAARCVEDYLVGLGEQGKFLQALGELREMMENPLTLTFARPACHSATHALGRIAYSQAQSVEAAFDLGDSTCNMGFFHGVVEALGDAVPTPEALVEQVPSVCSSFPQGERFMVCAHGIGHAAMRAYEGRIAPSVEACQVLEQQAAELCATGVFMEWVLEFIKAQRVPVLTPRVEPLSAAESEVFPPGLCLSVPDFQRPACFNEMFSTLGGHAKVAEYKDYVRWCGSDADCVHGLSVRLPEVLMGDHQSSFSVCLQARDSDLASTCFVGYLVSWASFSHDRDEFDEVCGQVPGSYADACAKAREIAYSSTLFFQE